MDNSFTSLGYKISHGVLGSTFITTLREQCIQDANLHGRRISDLGEAETLAVNPMLETHDSLIWLGEQLLTRIMSMPDVKYLSGAVIPKYRGEGRRAWHVDWWAWDMPETRWESPPAVGVLFYLNGTSATNGALLVAPGSHRRPVPDFEKSMQSFEPRYDELALPVNAGDVVVLDSRLMHGVCENIETDIRICVTMWFLTGWSKLSERVKATVRLSMDTQWQSRLGKLYPNYEGNAEPLPHVKYPKF